MSKKIWLYFIILQILIVFVLHSFGFRNVRALKEINYGREGIENFSIYKNHEGRIISSTDIDGKFPRRINILNLDTDSPSVLFENFYGVPVLFSKIYESSEAIIIMRGVSVSRDIITINKKNGVFVRMASGIVAGTYVVAEKGQLY